MRKMTNPNALLMTFCAVGVLAAGNPAWADSTITNCAQVTGTTEGDADSIPNNKASFQAILDAVTAKTNEDDEACAPINVVSIFDYGDAPDSYGTTTSTANPGGPAVHEIIPGLMLGSVIDEEADGTPNADANGDDATGADEEGYDVPSLTAGAAVTLSVTAKNTTDAAANLVCWIDYNGDGEFATDGSESGSTTVPAGTATSTAFNVVMPQVPATVMDDTSGTSYARCRLSTDTTLTAGLPVGALPDGEVEDKKVTFVAAPVFDLALTKKLTDPTATVQAGDNVSFDITVTNQGTMDATGIKIVDYIPTGFTLADANWTDNGDGTATLNTPLNPVGAPLASGATATVTITLKANDDITAGNKSNYAEIYEAADDQGNVTPDADSTPDTTNGNDGTVSDDVIDNTGGDQDDHDVAVVTIAPTVDVELGKAVMQADGVTAATTVRRGDTLIYVLTAENKGPDDATNVVVTDQLPAGLTYVSDDTGGTAYDSINGTWTVGDLVNGGSKSLKITVTVD
ncbi:MAG: DUF11 domain-containing protein [Thiolinea sp.]